MQSRALLPALRLCFFFSIGILYTCHGKEQSDSAVSWSRALPVKRIGLDYSRHLTIDGEELTFPCSRSALIACLGAPRRELGSEVNTLLVWDQLGLVVYVRPGETSVHSLLIAVAPKKKTILFPWEFWPKQLFDGEFAVAGSLLTRETTSKELRLSGFIRSYPEHKSSIWERPAGGNTVMVQLGSGGTGIEFISIGFSSKKQNGAANKTD